MGDGVERVSDVLPLTWVTKSIREPWLGIGTPVLALVLTAGFAVIASVFAVRRSAL
jgi:ABC-2 type transport system permease protein